MRARSASSSLLDVLLVAVAVLLGAWLAENGAVAAEGSGGRLVLAAAAGALVLGGSRGRVGGVGWLVLSGAGVACGFGASVGHGVGAIIAVAVLAAWRRWGGGLPMLAPLVAAAGAAGAVLYGGFAAAAGSPPSPGLAPWGAVGAALLAAALVVVRGIPRAATPAGARRALGVALGALALVLAGLPALPMLGFDPLVLAWAAPLAACVLAAVWALLAADARPPVGPG
ncbi:MAG TPA: hypothetical protein VK610_05445, partial [Rhodothermales bacterium]|nr:hypothetical protein [Rhodothermales bacterium]